MAGLDVVVKQLEEQRKKLMYIYGVVGLIYIIGIAILFKSLFGFLIVFVARGVSSFASKKAYQYRANAKQSIAMEMMRQNYDSVSLDAYQGFSESYIQGTEMIKLGNIFKSNDLFSGFYKGMHFRQAELLVQQYKKSGNKRATTTLFKGHYRVFEFNKNFASYMQIRVKEGFLFNKNTKPYRFFTQREKTTHLELENKEFNDIFDVHASDAHEAFYILTPHFMEKVMELNTAMNSGIVIGFIDNKMHIASPLSQEVYQVSIWRPISEKYLKSVEREAGIVRQIVDTLNLE